MKGDSNLFSNTQHFSHMKNLVSMLCIALCISPALGQFQVQYQHVNPLKFSLQHMDRIQIISNADKSSVRVRYAVSDEKKNKIVEVNFNLLDLKKGVNMISHRQGTLSWQNTPYRDLLQKDQLVSGNFQLCVGISDIYETLPDADECFDIELQSIDIENELNLDPIELKMPAHRDSIDEIRPQLTWIPPSPAYQNTEYLILLVEKKENQTCTEALNNNVPFINKAGVTQNILNYPTESPALEKSHTYCWRVSAYKDLKEYSRSEDWQFVVREFKGVSNSHPYVDDIVNKIVLFNKGENKIYINNMLNETKLNYKIMYNSKELVEEVTTEDYPITIGYGLNLLHFEDKLFERQGIYQININLNSKTYTYFLKK